MPINYYPKLAFESIKKNKQIYLPFIITSTLLIAIFYIISFLSVSESINEIPFGDIIQAIMSFGSWIIVLFSIIFLFYTNSFLFKQRKKEFGLYSILGMNRINLATIVFWEYLIIASITIFFGLLIGILFSKLFELGLFNLINFDINYNFEISGNSIFSTIILFGLIYFILFLNNLFQLRIINISELLLSENFGEKPPKGNWFISILGFIALGVGYYIALKIKDPVEALLYFFIASALVIIGTYLILISGSVLICRLLSQNKKFYYKLNHFISVSSMAFRMKRNGAGLASICILSTMVLVIMCSSVCLYIGTEDSLNSRYLRDINVTLSLNNYDNFNQLNLDNINNYINNCIHSQKSIISEPLQYYEVSSVGYINNNQIILINPNITNEPNIAVNQLIGFDILSLEEYNRLTKSNEVLNDNEVLIQYEKNNRGFKTFSLNGIDLKVKRTANNILGNTESVARIYPTVKIVIKNPNQLIENIYNNSINSDDLRFEYNYYYLFNINQNEEEQIKINNILDEELNNEEFRDLSGIIYSLSESKAENRLNFLLLDGGIVYIGVILSIIFILATILIIYYKQIAEGLEDRKRFNIMKNIGLSKKQIKKSINSQLLMVFFIPLIFAIINLVFAYPIIEKILLNFGFNNPGLFLFVTICCILIFSVCYSIIYKITSIEYYRIVA